MIGRLVAPLLLLLISLPVQAGTHRSWKAKHAFEVETGHPHGWPGHVVDHVISLKCGGPDEPSNMQWMTFADAKAKDRWETRVCRVIDGRKEGCCR